MNFYFEDYYIQGNEACFWIFIIAIIVTIAYTSYAVRKEIKKNDL